MRTCSLLTKLVILTSFLAYPTVGKTHAEEPLNLEKVNLSQDILIADFEGDDYGNWTVSGQAFGSSPARGTLPNQQQVFGFEGKGLVNTYFQGDSTTGTLTSPVFRVERNYINFLIGGGGYPGLTCMNLLVDGKVMRTAVGPNFNPGGSEQLDRQSWDVSDLVGRMVQIQIVDQHSGGWGHINVDQITQSNIKHQLMASKDRVFKFQQKYLNFPVKNGAQRRLIRLFVEENCVREFNIELATDEPDFWVYLDVSEFKGEEGTLRIYQYDSVCKVGFDAVFQADTFPGQDNLYKEKLRPQFHFTSRRGWVNDTNGMVYYDGEYHMFYQHVPYSWSSNDKTWGHAVSSDMLHWQELGDAIYPDALGAIWSGSAVIDHNNTAGFQTGSEKTMVCFYTSAGGTTPLSYGKPFTQSIAYSNDRGRTWTKYEQNPVIDHISGENRDPKVFWHKASNQWVMVLFWRDHIMGFFTSPDLKSWTKRSELKSFHECPELFELSVDGDPSNKKWILYGAQGDYLIGQFDGIQFVPEGDIVKFQYGNCFYASQTFNNVPASDGRRVQMAWGQVAMPDMPFNQMILFPVSLTLRSTAEGIRMYAEPIEEIKLLHQQHWQWNDLTVKSKKPLKGIKGELFHIKVELKPQDAQTCSIIIRDVPVVYDVRSRQLFCGDKSAPLKLVDGKIRLEILVDRMSIEIYANGGRVYMPIGINLTNHPDTLELNSEGGRTSIERLDIYKLKSSWF